MLILHLSDIHFRHPICNTDRDPDRPFRTRLIQDARERVKTLGSVDAILVGGDIAFAGKPEEYEAALKWMYDLADACGCDWTRIFVIPGNHDVDRDVIRKDLSVQNAQRAVVNAKSADDKEWQLQRQLQHAETGPALLRPIGAYNEFASRFSGAIFAPERMFWKSDLPLGEGVTLRVYGLNSTILSGWRTPEGENDVEKNCTSSRSRPLWTRLTTFVNLVMCHHPPDWLIDGDRVADDVNGRAPSISSAISIASASCATRSTSLFTPAPSTRNVRRRIGGQDTTSSASRSAKTKPASRSSGIAAHLLEWQTSSEGFKPIKDDDCDIHHADVRLRNVNPRPRAAVAAPATPAANPPTGGMEALMSEDRARSIVLRFWIFSI